MGFKDIPAYNNKSGFPWDIFASLCFYMYFCGTKTHINDYQRQNNEPQITSDSLFVIVVSNGMGAVKDNDEGKLDLH